jgi:hypothetical protein
VGGHNSLSIGIQNGELNIIAFSSQISQVLFPNRNFYSNVFSRKNIFSSKRRFGCNKE